VRQKVTRLETDICVIGAGSGGLSVAAGAAQMGARVMLVEKGKMGGDCLNYGCVPSKALIAAGKHAHALSSGAAFGVSPCRADIDYGKVKEHIAAVIAQIAPNDSQERFESLGVTVVRAPAHFTGRREIEAGDVRITARRFVVATGSAAGIPPIPGLQDVPYFTNETIFEKQDSPTHLVIIGGGPIGMEMAQAHRRLGAEVTVLEMFNVLSKDDPDLTAVVIRQLIEEGVQIHESIKIDSVAKTPEGVRIAITKDGAARTIEASHILVAAGRVPNIEDLNLAAAGIEYGARGIKVDARLRSSNKRVFAIGDVAGGLQFTHVAAYHAGIVIRNALFRLPSRADVSAVPWVTYTDPELAQVGLSEAEAKARHGDAIRVLTWPFADNDRAQAERRTEGLVKVIVGKRGRILGAGLAGPHAGELIYPWILSLSAGLKITAVANMIAPYPTLGEVSKRAAGSYYTRSLFSRRTKSIVRLLLKLG